MRLEFLRNLFFEISFANAFKCRFFIASASSRGKKSCNIRVRKDSFFCAIDIPIMNKIRKSVNQKKFFIPFKPCKFMIV